jgi:hypothetical protein
MPPKNHLQEVGASFFLGPNSMAKELKQNVLAKIETECFVLAFELIATV